MPSTTNRSPNVSSSSQFCTAKGVVLHHTSHRPIGPTRRAFAPVLDGTRSAA